MKISIKSALSIIVSIILITSITSYAASSKNLKPQQVEQPVSYLQLKSQVSYFRQAIDELGVTSPLQVAKLWAKGEETRNGVYQYSVSCNELKTRLIKKWGNADESYWIIGGSSPWVSEYEIVQNKRLNSATYEITIKYHWSHSGGDLDPTFNILTIIKNNDYWCVKEVKETK
jgi:hypothetical protein